MSPLPVIEGQLASSVSAGQESGGLWIAQKREEHQEGANVAGVGSFEFPISRRMSIVFGIGPNVVRILPVTQKVIPLLS